MFGREARLPIDVAFGVSADGSSADTHLKHIQKIMSFLYLDATVEINLKNGLRPKDEPAKGAQDLYVAEQSKGKYGLQVLASVIIACQANDFVLTGSSNLSRMIDEIRRTVIDLNFGAPTRMINVTWALIE